MERATIRLAPGGRSTRCASHPRRDQVNDRLANQNERIHKEVTEDEMSKAQAHKLHKEDRHIRHEEQAMASQDGGQITKQEQKTLY